MDKNSSVRVVGFPKENYDKEWLDTLNDRERSDAALADGDTSVFEIDEFSYEDLRELQDTVPNSPIKEQLIGNWWYFLND